MPHIASGLRANSASPAATTITASSMTRFIRGAFTESLCNVDFTQAVKAVDQLAALDERRKRDFRSALHRLNIDANNLEQSKMELQETSPVIYDWILSLEDKARKAEALYTQAYIGLRRWALINEMRLLPFQRSNCLAMLDALYPAEYSTLPTPQLTQLILNSQRDAFLKYIDTVGKHGRPVLKNLENQSKRPGDVNGWPVVHDILERYLKQCNRVINACNAITGREVFDRAQTSSSPIESNARSGRPSLRTSGSHPPPVTTSRRPSTAAGTTSAASSSGESAGLSSPPGKLRKDQEEWLAKQRAKQQAQEPPRQLKKSRSTLNRLAQEFRRFKSKSTDSQTDGPLRPSSALEHRSTPFTPSRSASRDHSVGPSSERVQHSRTHSRAASTERIPTISSPMGGNVTIDDAYRERLIEEAKRNKANREKRQHSPTHFKLEEERRHQRPSPFALGEEDDDRYFFITDSATRKVSATSLPSASAASRNPYAPPTRDLQIAELAA